MQIGHKTTLATSEYLLKNLKNTVKNTYRTYKISFSPLNLSPIFVKKFLLPPILRKFCAMKSVGIIQYDCTLEKLWSNQFLVGTFLRKTPYELSGKHSFCNKLNMYSAIRRKANDSHSLKFTEVNINRKITINITTHINIKFLYCLKLIFVSLYCIAYKFWMISK